MIIFLLIRKIYSGFGEPHKLCVLFYLLYFVIISTFFFWLLMMFWEVYILIVGSKNIGFFGYQFSKEFEPPKFE